VGNLFRREALEHRRQDWLGSIQLIRPLSLSVLTGLVVLTAAVVAGYLTLGEYTRKARVSGYLVPDRGVIRLVPPQAATVVEAQATEGQAVHAGDVLFVLAVGQATLSGDTQAAVQSSLATREQSLLSAARERVQLEQAQSAAIDAQIAKLQGRIEELQQIRSAMRME